MSKIKFEVVLSSNSGGYLFLGGGGFCAERIID